MADPVILRRNERLKASAGQAYNLAAALIGALAVKLYSDWAPSLAAAVWLIGSVGLAWGGHNLLGLIEDEG
jgi:hypothetical protein